jgi:hypothetical protein
MPSSKVSPSAVCAAHSGCVRIQSIALSEHDETGYGACKGSSSTQQVAACKPGLSVLGGWKCHVPAATPLALRPLGTEGPSRLISIGRGAMRQTSSNKGSVLVQWSRSVQLMRPVQPDNSSPSAEVQCSENIRAAVCDQRLLPASLA